MVYKTYKYRIYPNKEQETLIQKTFGCCRFVYNQTLQRRKEVYEKENKTLSRIDCNNYCNRELKNKYPWLKEVDKHALTSSIFNMDNAYQKFFNEHLGYPKFKSKHESRKSYRTYFNNNNISVDFELNKIKLPKLKTIKAKLHRKFDGKIKSATVLQVPSGKYYVCILVETQHEKEESTGCIIGIDLGIKDLVITSDGEKYANIKAIEKYENKLVKEQRKLSRKKKCSKNWEKQRIVVTKIHEKIRNSRIDNLHKISHKLIVENQVIISEDLTVSNMVKNHNLARAISDCGWYELLKQLEYKSMWNERQYIKIDKFYASSQMCSCCGYQNSDIKNLSIRKWVCPNCKIEHDRDINAARNILAEGIKQIS